MYHNVRRDSLPMFSKDSDHFIGVFFCSPPGLLDESIPKSEGRQKQKKVPPTQADPKKGTVRSASSDRSVRGRVGSRGGGHGPCGTPSNSGSDSYLAGSFQVLLKALLKTTTSPPVQTPIHPSGRRAPLLAASSNSGLPLTKTSLT